MNEKEQWFFERQSCEAIANKLQGFDFNSEESQNFFNNYTEKLIAKLIFLKMIKIEQGHIVAQHGAEDWLQLNIEKKALSI